MSLRPGEVERVLAEAVPFLAGAVVERVLSPAPRELLLSFGGGRPALLLSTHPEFARLHLVSGAPRRAAPSHLAARVDERLSGQRLEDAACAPGERIVRIRFSGSAPATLVAELFGRASNLLLLDEAGRILEVERRAEGRRPLAPGSAYAPPPAPPAGAPSPVERFDASAFASRPFPLNAAVEAHYRDAAARAAFESLQRDLLRRVEGRAKNRRARLRGLERRRESLAQAESLRRQGELLKANWPRLRRGLEAVDVVDFFDPAQRTVSIPLDPALDPRETVERLFRRYRKLVDAAAPVAREIARATAEVARLEDARRRLLDLSETEGILDLTARLEEEGVLAPPPAPPPSRRAIPAPRRPLRFRSADGLEVWVGGDARENDRLTFSLARGSDLWLHARGVPGAHVVVRLPRGKTAPLETLLDAAALAVHFSKARGAGRAEVAYTLAKFVRKPRGAPPGLVTIAGEKTLLVAPDPPRLERLTRPALAPVDPPPNAG